MKVVINITCDENYSPYAKIFINSLNQNAPGAHVMLRAVNCHPNTINSIEALGNNISVLQDNTRLSTKRDILSHGKELIYDGLFDSMQRNKTGVRSPKLLCSEQMAYCSNIKFMTIADLLSDGSNDIIIYMDIDTIIRGPLDDMYERVSRCDLAMYMDEPYTSQHPGSTRLEECEALYHGGLICVNNNDKTRELFHEWSGIVKDDMKNWDVDEKLFYSVHRRDDISVDVLPVTFKDEDLNEMSVIWSGAGQTKFTQDVYIDECRRYDSTFK